MGRLGHTRLTVKTKNGDSHTACDVSAAALLEPSQGPVVAATPGYFVVSLTHSTDDDLSDFTMTPDLIPVVVWHTRGGYGKTWVEPINCFDGEQNLAVLAPNGVVYSPADAF